MSPETLKAYLDEWVPILHKTTSIKETEQALSYLIREVERDTRHAACDMVNKLDNNIHNMRR